MSADSSAWRPRTLDCAGAGKIDFLLPPSEFMTAFLPLHEAAWARILTILQVSVVSDTYVSKPLASQDRDRLVTCGYTDPDGLVIRIVGVLTNGK